MAKLSQLRLLLWKNFVIKRRQPLVLFLETAVPLVLFLILGWIRHNNPTKVFDNKFGQAKALPSTGLLSMMQQLCSQEPAFPINGDGLPSLPENSSFHRLLENIDSVYRDVDALYLTNKSLALLDWTPLEYYQPSIIDQLAVLLLNYTGQMPSSEQLDPSLEQRLFENIGSYYYSDDSINVGNLSDSISHHQFKNSSSTQLLEDAFGINFRHRKPLFSNAVMSEHRQKNNASHIPPDFINYIFAHLVKNGSVSDRLRLNKSFHAINVSLTQADIYSVHKKSADVLQFNQTSSSSLFDLSQNRAFLSDLSEFIRFHDTLDGLAKLAAYFPLDACQHQENEQGDLQSKNFTYGHHPSNNNLNGFYKIFKSLESAVCPNVSSDYWTDPATRQSYSSYFPIWIRYLKGSPKVLFTPSTGIARLVMKKANRTFELIDQITVAANLWLSNVSVVLHNVFKQPQTEKKLENLRVAQAFLESTSGLSNSTHHERLNSSQKVLYRKALAQFLEIQIKNSTEVLAQLDLIDRAACSWVELMSTVDLSFFVPFKNEHSAVDYVLNETRQDNISVVAVIVFDLNETDDQLKPHTSYKIRMNSTFFPSVRRIRPIYWSPIPRNWDYLYYYSGFSLLQDVVDRAIIDVLVGHDVVEPGTFVTNAPMPCYLYDIFLFTTSMILPLCMTISFVYSTSIFVQNIVAEKEYRLKEFMKVMGLSNTVHGLAWFITAFAQLTLSMTIVTLLLRYTQVLLHSNPFIIWLILEFYAVATITFSFLMSSFFSKAKIASAFAGMIYFLSYVPAMCIGIREDISGGDIPASFKQIASLLSTSAFGLSCKYISLRESEGAGVHWNNLVTSPIEHDSFSLAHAFVFLAMDSVIYILLAVYVENVHPGSYGIPKPWYFPFTKVYWTGLPNEDYDEDKTQSIIKFFKSLVCRDSAQSYQQLLQDEPTAETEGSHIFEAEPTGLILGVEIDQLTKVYKKTGKVAVNGLSLKLYESQITGLLGHNGAGKTSTMSVLTGILPPTSGAIRIYGLDMAKNLDLIRSSVGYCPQHNVLFEQLTPEEHLRFYSGFKSATTKGDIEQMLRDVGLAAKSSTPVGHLSGGMKRKLSIALAFIGQSRLVILDEPTAGVDPYSRRAIWDLIVKYKAGRTILLSTHHMDEADVLSDRIAVISNGRLKCAGSSIFLRNTFCDGYHLICVKSNKTRRPCDETVAFVTRFLPSAYLYSESKLELHFILPYAEERQGHFPAFFNELNENLAEINVSTYGVYDSTLEEAFLHITRTAQCEEGQTFVQRGHRRQSSDASAASFRATSTTNTRRRQSTGRADDDVPLISRTQGGRGHSRQPSDVSFIESAGILAPISSVPQTAASNHSRQRSIDSIHQLLGQKSAMTEASKLQAFDSSSLLSAAGVVPIAQPLSNRREERSHLKHFYALTVKRLLYVRRNPKILFAQTFLPAIFVSIAMSMAFSAPLMGDVPPLDLSPAQFLSATEPRGLFTPITNYQKTNFSSIANSDGWTDASAAQIAATFYLVSGMSANCTLKASNFSLSQQFLPTDDIASYFSPGCYGAHIDDLLLAETKAAALYQSISPNTVPVSNRLYYPICQCATDSSGLICPTDYKKPLTTRLATGDYLVNVGNQNLTEYLLYTADEFRQHRYGGIAFGNELDHVPVKFGTGDAAYLRRLATRHVTDYFIDHRGYHTLPVFLNAVNNAILRANVAKRSSLGNPAAYGITTYSHAINGTDQMLDQELILQGTDMMIAIFIVIAMSFVPASFVVFLVYERSSLVKHSQMMAGLHPLVYWVSNYSWDFANYFIPAASSIAILMAFNVPAYVAGENLAAIVLLFVLYGWSMTPMMYPTSFYFDEPSKAYVVLVVFNLFFGTTTLVTTFLLDNFRLSPVLKTADNVLKVVFLLFPSYSLGRGIMDVAINHYRNQFYSLAGQYQEMSSPFVWEITLRNYLAMLVEGFVFFGITLFLEMRRDLAAILWPSSRKARRSWLPPSIRESHNDDSDVIAERHRVLSGETSTDLLVIDGLTKQYSSRSGRTLALDRLSLGLPPGECFGLLGLNGAGKSTTFSMLSGIFSPTAGEARLGSRVLCGGGKPSADVLRSVGYCPQTDPLLDELTAREHLQLYARIRGINAQHESQVVSWLLERMGLDLYSDKPSRTFSGGTKRKLSAALALLGDPSIVLLDEPTTGMDPGSRRFLWNLILELRSENRLVVLTSHSMEECEVLCSRLGVMVAGKLRCLGSTQQLKDKFGNGYHVTIRLPPCQRGASRSSSSSTQHRPSTELLQEAFNRAGLPSSSWRFIAQRHQIVELALLYSRLNLSIIFSLLNKLRASHTIADFSVSQNTLDSVFLRLAQGAQPCFVDGVASNSVSIETSGNNNDQQFVDPASAVWADDELTEEPDDVLLLS